MFYTFTGSPLQLRNYFLISVICFLDPEREVEENSFQESTKKPRISREEQKPKVIERERKISEVEVDGTKELHVTLSPHSSSGDPPEVDELIKALLVSTFIHSLSFSINIYT